MDYPLLFPVRISFSRDREEYIESEAGNPVPATHRTAATLPRTIVHPATRDSARAGHRKGAIQWREPAHFSVVALLLFAKTTTFTNLGARKRERKKLM